MFISCCLVTSCYNFVISLLRWSTIVELSSLMTALFWIFFALLANSKVDKVSPILMIEGEMLPIRTVLLLPPRESRRMKVSLLSLYGMCRALPSAYSTSDMITFPRADNDLLIIPASFIRFPLVSVEYYLSEPAKSTILKREFLIFHPSCCV